MRYACLLYYDPHVLFGGSPEAKQVLGECAGYDTTLKERGQFIASEALVLPDDAVTVRVRQGNVSTTDGPFMETKEMLGGIILIEARDLNDAVRIASGHPIARIGSVEVRPGVDFSLPPPDLSGG